jgi:hypothetical protein
LLNADRLGNHLPRQGLSIEIMIKKFLLTPALLSLTLAVGCAKGGNGMGNGIVVTVSDGSIPAIYVTSSVTFTAKVTGTSNTAVAWTLVGTACTGTPNPCGTIDVNTGVFQAPANPPSPTAISIIATSKADSTASGSLGVHVVPVTVVVAPAVTPAVNVGHGLVQQFTAVAVPDNAPQTFTWTCTVGGAACANFVSNSSGLATYTAVESACGNGCVTVFAVSKIDPTGCAIPKDCTAAKVSVVASRLAPGNYALRFSGHDGSNNPVTAAGSITVASNGTISGVEDELSASGYAQHLITGGSYTASTLNDHNTNNAGVLKLTGASPSQYQVVLDAIGDFQLLEADGNGTGSGMMQKSATAQFNTGTAQKFVFGFTGVDAGGKRVGHVGLLPTDGVGSISGGLLDPNDNGNNVCGAQPCNVTGTYSADPNIAGLWHMTLSSFTTSHFDFFVSSGQTKNVPFPLTLYAISTDPVDGTHPALSGSMVFQDPSTTYDKTALNAFAVSSLTGVDSTGSNTLVSLVTATGDSNGNISGSFDANNAGTIVAAQSFNCTYTSGTTGRYVVTLLGNGSTCTAPALPFVLYASGANRGFLLDQSSAAVMIGAMDPQSGNAFAPTQLPSTYAVVTGSSATSGVSPIAANLLLTSTGNQTFVVAGTQYPGAQPVTGAYTLSSDGTGTITLTAPAAKYVLYTVDATHTEMIDVDTAVKNAAVILVQQ